MKPSPQEDPDWTPPEGGQTLEGQFYFVARSPRDDLASVLALLHALFRGDYWLYFRMIQSVREELATEVEEWALRWRSGRLEDLGFPSWDSAMRIYGYLRPDRRAEIPESGEALDLEAWSLPVWITDLPGMRSDERALFRAARDLDADERSGLFYGLIALSNRVAVADRLELGDAESLPGAIDKATRLASDGLEFVAEHNGISLTEALRRVPVERLFRVGVQLDPESVLPPLQASRDEGDEESPSDGDAGNDSDEPRPH